MKTEEEIREQLEMTNEHINYLKEKKASIGCALYETAKKILEWVLEE